MSPSFKFLYTTILASFLAAAFTGCTKRDTANSGCLAGSSVSCDDGSDKIIQDSTTPSTKNTANVESSSQSAQNLLQCSVTATPAQVAVDETITISVTTTGARGPISIKDGLGNVLVGSAASSGSFFKSYNASRAGQVMQETLLVQDTENQYAYCTYQVAVKVSPTLTSTAPATQVGCIISASPTTPQLGQPTEFLLTATGTLNSAFFSNFYGSSDWQLADSYIQPLSSTLSKIKVIYQYPGTKSVSVRVSAQGQVGVCSLQVTTSGTVPAPAASALACDMKIAPLGAVISNSSIPSLAGSLSKIHLTGVGGTAPYTIDSLTAQPSVSNLISPPPVFAMDVIVPAVADNSLVRTIRFRQAGVPVIQAVLKDSAGKEAICSSNYLVRANSVIATGQLAGTGSMPRVRIYNAAQANMLEDFHAYPSTFTGGVAIAAGDFNSDALSDYVTIESSAGLDLIRLFKGNLNAWYSGKPAPLIIWSGYGGLPADGSERHLSVGDYNGDGISDIAISNGCTGTAAINPKIRIINGADKTLMKEWTPVLANGAPMTVSGLASGDINADGYSDLAAISCDGLFIPTFSGSVLASTASPTMLTSFSAGTSGTLASLAMGDFNRDGKSDLVIVSHDNGTAWIRIVSGVDNTLLLNTHGLAGSIRYNAGVADVDGDGVSDLLIAASNNGATGVLSLFNGATTITNQSAQATASFSPFYWWNGAFGVGSN